MILRRWPRKQQRNRSMSQNTKSEVAQLFSKHGAVLVHCSGEVKGTGNDETNNHTPIGRIVNAFETRPDVCCSTVQRGDQLKRKNYYGPLGLIIDPVEFGNITVSWPGDAGTSLDPSKKRISTRGFGCNTSADVSRAITERGCPQLDEINGDPYNEICCVNFKVVGLFADGLSLEFATDKWPGYVRHEIDEVGSILPELPLFLWATQEGCFLRLRFDPSMGRYDRNAEAVSKVPIGEVYDSCCLF